VTVNNQIGVSGDIITRGTVVVGQTETNVTICPVVNMKASNMVHDWDASFYMVLNDMIHGGMSQCMRIGMIKLPSGIIDATGANVNDPVYLEENGSINKNRPANGNTVIIGRILVSNNEPVIWFEPERTIVQPKVKMVEITAANISQGYITLNERLLQNELSNMQIFVNGGAAPLTSKNALTLSGITGLTPDYEVFNPNTFNHTRLYFNNNDGTNGAGLSNVIAAGDVLNIMYSL
jgi:hypothetical protein